MNFTSSYWRQRARLCVRSAIVRWCAVWCIVLLAVWACGSCNKSQAPRPALRNPRYLEVVSLADSADHEHPISLEARNGQLWYASSQPGLTLAECTYDKAFVTSGPDNKWSLVIPIEGALNLDAFCMWTKERRGSYGGVLLGGELVFAAEITECPKTGQLWISAFETRDEAARQLGIVQSGG
jgi:hypothetical protein